MLLTLSPLSAVRRQLIVRLACLIHAASVQSEPGSNSPLQKWSDRAAEPPVSIVRVDSKGINVLAWSPPKWARRPHTSSHCSVFKERSLGLPASRPACQPFGQRALTLALLFTSSTRGLTFSSGSSGACCASPGGAAERLSCQGCQPFGWRAHTVARVFPSSTRGSTFF